MEYGEEAEDQFEVTYQDYLFGGKEFDRKFELNLYDFGARTYDGTRGQWTTMDPLAEKRPWESPYGYCGNNPLNRIDKDGQFWDAVLDAAFTLYDVGEAIYQYIKTGSVSGTTKAALGADVLAFAVPGVTGAGLGVRAAAHVKDAVKAVDKVVDVGKAVDKAENTSKTYQTYTKVNSKTGEVYSGRTSGTKTPRENVEARDKNHHKNKDGFGPAKLDKSSSNKDAIRGREQQLIDMNGWAKSTGGTSGNVINGVSPNNPNGAYYEDLAKKLWGIP
ncbi:MAG: RHS repeat-associated core domain-containing protein, partial [Bacteroidales bacterium]|jgi:RHS repeat-associated protein